MLYDLLPRAAMRRVTLSSLVATAVFLPACATSGARRTLPVDAPLACTAWLAGAWSGAQGAATVEENWTAPRGGTMYGVNRTIVDDRTVAFEFLRIAAGDDGPVYTAWPSASGGTDFAATECRDGYLSFENPAHDFPQRIIYERDGDDLVVRIEGEQRGQPAAAQWRWERE